MSLQLDTNNSPSVAFSSSSSGSAPISRSLSSSGFSSIFSICSCVAAASTCPSSLAPSRCSSASCMNRNSASSSRCCCCPSSFSLSASVGNSSVRRGSRQKKMRQEYPSNKPTSASLSTCSSSSIIFNLRFHSLSASPKLRKGLGSNCGFRCFVFCCCVSPLSLSCD